MTILRLRKQILLTTLLFLFAFVMHHSAAAAPRGGKGRFVLVIDAGHGGKDNGATGKISKEKDINLNVALAFGRLVEDNCPDVKVIYTRKTDVFVTLQGRADIANRNKANLFISVHTNSMPPGITAPRGTETYTVGMHSGKENLAVAKRENSVITQEANYRTVYKNFDPNKSESYIIFEFMQDRNMKQSVDLARSIQTAYADRGRKNKGVHQAGFLVLRATAMPSVLTEVGFISNPEEERFLNSKEGVRQLARSLYDGFRSYRSRHYAAADPAVERADAGRTLAAAVSPPSAPKPTPAQLPPSEVSDEAPSSARSTPTRAPRVTPVPTRPFRPTKQPVMNPPARSVVPPTPREDFTPHDTPRPRPDSDSSAATADERRGTNVTVGEQHRSASPVEEATIPSPTDSAEPRDATERRLADAGRRKTAAPVEKPLTVAVMPSESAQRKNTAAESTAQSTAAHTAGRADTLPPTAPSDRESHSVRAPRTTAPKHTENPKPKAALAMHGDTTRTTARNETPRQKPEAQKRNTADTATTKNNAAKSNETKHITFKVQILTSDKQLSPTDPRFKGLSPVNFYHLGPLFRYTYGSSRDYAEIKAALKRAAALFPKAFIVAFDGEKRIENLQEAIRLSKEK